MLWKWLKNPKVLKMEPIQSSDLPYRDETNTDTDINRVRPHWMHFTIEEDNASGNRARSHRCRDGMG